MGTRLGRKSGRMCSTHPARFEYMAAPESRVTTMSSTAQDWIARLNLLPHPEGGYYREVYRSTFNVSPSNNAKTIGSCTSIHYLLQGEDFSAFHRLAYPELWYFHDGASLDVHSIDPAGNYSVKRLGKGEGESLSLAIEPGVWFAAEVHDKSGFALVSCVVAPAFDFSVFEMAKKDELIRQWPEHREVLERLCRI